jgi:hypothetical protein
LSVPTFTISKVKIYPNPVLQQLSIEADEAIQKITVYDLLGKEVLVKSPQSKLSILQTSLLEKGIYVVKTTIGGKDSISKFIKE